MTNHLIGAGKIDPHPLSFLDKNGRLFKIKGEFYRGINLERAAFYESLFTTKIIDKVVSEKLLVPTEICDLEIQGYPLILQHYSIPFISYPHEWCDLMLKDAANVFLQLNIELQPYNAISFDARSLNIVFDGSHPLFVDFCAILPIDESMLWERHIYNLFYSYFLYPLTLMSHGYGRIARCLMQESYYLPKKLRQSELEALKLEASTLNLKAYTNKLISFLSKFIPVHLKKKLKKNLKSASNQNSAQKKFFLNLQKQVNQLELTDPPEKQYRCFDLFYSESLEPAKDWTLKQENINRILCDLKPDSVLDLDSNKGWYAQLAAHHGSKVIAFDTDEFYVRKLYRDARQKNAYILPLIMNWMSPSFNLHNQFFPPVHERLNADLVLGLTLVQHLIFNRYHSLETTVSKLSDFSHRWLVVEYVPKEELVNFISPQDQYTMEWWQTTDWYTLDQFIDILKLKFSKIEIFPSHSASTKILLCEK